MSIFGMPGGEAVPWVGTEDGAFYQVLPARVVPLRVVPSRQEFVEGLKVTLPALSSRTLLLALSPRFQVALCAVNSRQDGLRKGALMVPVYPCL